MKKRTPKHRPHPGLSRRRFLQGLGGLTLGLPLLAKFGAHEAWASGGIVPPKRLIVMTYPMGVQMDRWMPDATGSSFNLNYITAPLESFKDRCLFVSNCDMAVMRLNASHLWGHPAKKEAALTGTLMTGAFTGDGSNVIDNVIADGEGSTDGGPNGESICNFIGSRIRQAHHLRPSIDLGINGRGDRERNEVTSSFFFEGPANPITVQCNPARAFNATFAGVNLDDAAQAALRSLRERNKSVLDAVRGSFTDLRQGLDPADRAILDDHADRIRTIELELQNITCTLPEGIPNDGTTDPSWELFRGMSMRELAGLQTSIMSHAMACDIAPVGRMEVIDQQNPFFGLPNVDDEIAAWNGFSKDWHSMVHGDASPIDGIPTRPNAEHPEARNPALLDGYRFFVQSFADLLAALDSVVEGPDDRTMLDNSLCVLASDYGNGNGHNSNKMGWILAGNTGPARNGFHFDCAPGKNFYEDSDYHTNQLLVSMIEMFCLTQANGSPYQEFGLRGFSTGPIGPLFG